jgi:AcrR family transcriptional regulator
MARNLSEDARAKLLKAASEVVLDAGVRGFTLDEVARRSGVAKTTMYRHFANGRELLIAAIDNAILRPSIPNTGSLRKDLREFLATVLPIFADARLRVVFLDLLSAASRDPALAEVQRTMNEARMVPLRTIYSRAKDRGEIAPGIDFDTAFFIIEGPLVARSILKQESFKELDLDDTVDRILMQIQP